MSANKQKLELQKRPKMTPREKKGLAIIAALLLATYVLVILVLGGQVPGEPFLYLDPTGHLQRWAQRWVNASIPYRERMVPVFIICVYFYVAVMTITFMTENWVYLQERLAQPKSELWRIIPALAVIAGVSVLYFSLGKDFPIQDPHKLSRFFERQAFANKYSFVLMLFAITVLSFVLSKIAAGFYVKLKLLINPKKETRHGN